MDPPTIEINTASAEQIAKLYGIGPGLAVRIVESREAEGSFAGPEDLARVKGISDRLAGTLAPYIDWSLPPAAEPSGVRDYATTAGWLLLAVSMTVASWPLIGTIQQAVDLDREGLGLSSQELIIIIGRSSGMALFVLAILLRAIYSLDTGRRLARRASNLIFVLATVLLVPVIAILGWNDFQSASYRTDPQAQIRLFALTAGALALFPQVLAWWRPGLIGRRFLTYWLNGIFLLLLLALLLQEFRLTSNSAYRIGIVLLAAAVTGRMVWGLLRGSLPLQPVERSSPRTPDARLLHGADSATGGRAGQHWRWLSWPGWAGLQGILAVAALLVALLGLFPDPLGFTHRTSELPRLIEEIEPSRELDEWYEWFRFFERNESHEVYLDLSFELQENLNATDLLPAKRTRARSLTIRTCEPSTAGDCTEVVLIVLADPEVEEHVFFSGADPDGRIKGHFIVDDYFTQMGLVQITLKPLSIVNVKDPFIAEPPE